MKTVKQTLAILFLSLIVSLSLAQELPKPVLNLDDIDLFVKTSVQMTQELNEKGIELEGDKNIWSVNDEVKAILTKYGWDYQSFGQKFAAISLGYSYLTMINNIDKMPEAQKAAAEQMKETYAEQYKSLVHEDDLKLIESKMKDLDAMDWNEY